MRADEEEDLRKTNYFFNFQKLFKKVLFRSMGPNLMNSEKKLNRVNVDWLIVHRLKFKRSSSTLSTRFNLCSQFIKSGSRMNILKKDLE